MKLRLTLCLGFLVAATGMLSGCSGAATEALPETVSATGKVTFNGTPLESAVVTFMPKGSTEGIECYAITDEAGEFTMKQLRGGEGAPPGDYTVVINRYVTADGKAVILDGTQAPANLGAVESLPPQYSSAVDSQLSAKVPESGGEFTFDLKG